MSAIKDVPRDIGSDNLSVPEVSLALTALAHRANGAMVIEASDLPIAGALSVIATLSKSSKAWHDKAKKSHSDLRTAAHQARVAADKGQKEAQKATAALEKASIKCEADLLKLSAEIAAAHPSFGDAASELLLTQRPGTLLASVTGVGSHTAKIPDARLSEGETAWVLAPQELDQAFPGVTFGTYDMERAYSGSGNAANNPAFRFFTMTFILRNAGAGEHFTVAEILARDPADATRAAFLSLFSAPALALLNQFGDAFRVRMAKENVLSSIQPLQRSVLMPVFEEEGVRYVELSPLVNFGAVQEMSLRIRAMGSASATEGENEEQTAARVNRTTQSVGGTKPQNASLMVSDIGGRLLRLESLPPRFAAEGYGEATTVSLLHSGNRLFQSRVRRAILERLQRALESNRQNQDSRQRINGALGALMQEVASRVEEFAEALRDGHLPEDWDADAHADVVALAAHISSRGDTLSAEDEAGLVEGMVNAAIRAVARLEVKGTPLLISADMKELFRETAAPVLTAIIGDR